jgi:hypothetical protein
VPAQVLVPVETVEGVVLVDAEHISYLFSHYEFRPSVARNQQHWTA